MKKMMIIALSILTVLCSLTGLCFANAERNMLVNAVKLDSMPTTYLVWTSMSNDLSNEYTYNLADEKGNVIIERYVDDFYGFDGNVAKIRKNGSYNFIKRDGTFLIDRFYDDVKPFSEGYACFKKDDKWGYIDENGTTSIEAVYDIAYSFKHGVAPIKQGTLYGFIDIQGEYLYIPQFKYISFYEDDTYRVCIVQDLQDDTGTLSVYKYGFVNEDGKMILDPIYDSVTKKDDLIVSELCGSKTIYKRSDNKWERITIWRALLYDPAFVFFWAL